MKLTYALAPLLALLFVAPPASATSNTLPPPAIAFADHGGVRDWIAVGDQTVYVEDGFRQWYRATLFSPSTDLPFAQAIGFDTRPAGRLDRWSSVVIHGRNYPIRAFERVDGPPVMPALVPQAVKTRD